MHSNVTQTIMLYQIFEQCQHNTDADSFFFFKTAFKGISSVSIWRLFLADRSKVINALSKTLQCWVVLPYKWQKKTAVQHVIAWEACQIWHAAPKLPRHVSSPSASGRLTITSVTPSVGCVSPASHHRCRPNTADFDGTPPTRLWRGAGAVRGRTLRTSAWIMWCLHSASL